MSLSPFLQAIDQERFQISPEAVEGTRKEDGFVILPTSRVEIEREGAYDTYKRSGSRHVGPSRENRAWSTVNWMNGLDYNEIPFLLNAAFRVSTPTLVVGSVGVYDHVADVLQDAPNGVKTYTLEKGSSAYVRRSAGVRLNQFTFKSARSGSLEISAGGFGLAMEDSMTTDPPIAITAGATPVPKAPMSGKDVGYYIADTPAGLATALLLKDAFGGELGLGSISDMVWTHNQKESYEGSVEQAEPKGTAKLLLPVKASYIAIANELKSGKFYYMRIHAVGPEIETGFNYELQMDVAVTVDAVRKEKAEQNTLATEIPLIWGDDPVWGKVLSYRVRNAVPSY